MGPCWVTLRITGVSGLSGKSGQTALPASRMENCPVMDKWADDFGALEGQLEVPVARQGGTKGDVCRIRLVYITPRTLRRRRVARALVEERLAACANIFDPIKSVFRWEGETGKDLRRS